MRHRKYTLLMFDAFPTIITALIMMGTADAFGISTTTNRYKFSMTRNHLYSPKVTTGIIGRPCNVDAAARIYLLTSLAASKPDNNIDHIKTLPSSRWRSNLPLYRSHERAIFAFYLCAGLVSTLLWFKGYHSRVQMETTLCLIWSTLVLAISFLEAWVKFKAPFLRKHVAVDVGRHVFAALNAAELGLSTSFWLGRGVAALQPTVQNNVVLPLHSPLPAFPLLPGLATAVLILEVLVVAPKLFLRAKAQIVKGFASDGDPPDAQNNEITTILSAKEASCLQKLADEVKDQPLPSPKWHFIYVLLEMGKIVCLNVFVSHSWRKSMPIV